MHLKSSEGSRAYSNEEQSRGDSKGLGSARQRRGRGRERVSTMARGFIQNARLLSSTSGTARLDETMISSNRNAQEM